MFGEVLLEKRMLPGWLLGWAYVPEGTAGQQLCDGFSRRQGCHPACCWASWVCEIAEDRLAVQQIHWGVCLVVGPAAGTYGCYGMTGYAAGSMGGRVAAWLAIGLALGVFWMVV